MGLMTDLGAWSHAVHYFMGLRDGYQLCVYDNRGIGKSTAPKERYTTSQMAGDALQLLNHLVCVCDAYVAPRPPFVVR